MRPNKLLSQNITQDSQSNRWLLTFSDTVTLLLAFFALLISFSEIDPSKMEQVTQSTTKYLGTTGSADQVEVLSIDELVKEVVQIIEQENLHNQVEVEITNRGVIVTGTGSLFFDSGQVNVKKQAKKMLNKFASKMNDVPYNIAIEGHTDNIPIKSSIFPSNWELSTARSSNIVRYLIEKGVNANKLRAVGFSDTKPKVKNNNSENRAINRRIEIVFLISS